MQQILKLRLKMYKYLEKCNLTKWHTCRNIKSEWPGSY